MCLSLIFFFWGGGGGGGGGGGEGGVLRPNSIIFKVISGCYVLILPF